jgi:hypothetical protein
MLSFAWVMQNCGTPNTQPQFNIKIKDSAGNLITILPCNPATFVSDPNLPNLNCRGNINAMDWVTTGYSLESLMGKTIKIYFEARDCTTGSHFGYAYVTADCRPMQIELAYCHGSTTARLMAPEGFMSYEWTRSGDPNWRVYTRQVNAQLPLDGEIFTVTVTNSLGCSAQLKTVIERTDVHANFMFGVKGQHGIPNHVCFPCNNYQNWYDTSYRTATFVDMSTVINSRKDRITWAINGSTLRYSDSLLTYTFPDPLDKDSVTHLVRLQVEAENGCADTFSQPITIYHSSEVKINEPTVLCEENTIRLIPNPTTGTLHVTGYALQGEADYTVYSVVGQVVMQGKLQCRDVARNVPTINVEPLAKGMYFLKIDGKTVKFVKE